MLAKNPKGNQPSQFVLQFNALGLAFLGFESAKDIRLVPVSLTDTAVACLKNLASDTGSRAANVFAALSRCYDKEQVCAELNVDSVVTAAYREKKHKVKVTRDRPSKTP